MFLGRRGYHPHINTACTWIKSSGFILTFEYLLLDRTLDNELRFVHYFQSSASIELISSPLWMREKCQWWEQSWLGEGNGAGNLPTFSSPAAGEGLGFYSSAIHSDKKRIRLPACPPHRILVRLISQYLHSSEKTL